MTSDERSLAEVTGSDDLARLLSDGGHGLVHPRPRPCGVTAPPWRDRHAAAGPGA